MGNAPDVSKEYLKGAVLTASPEQLHLMLLDGAIRFATRGRQAIQEGKLEDMFTALERAQRIVIELSNGIRREVNPLLGDQMLALYGFIYRRLIDANLQRDVQAVDDALRILRHQRETWVLLIEKIQKAFPGPARPDARAKPTDAADTPSTGFVAEG
jgi:flagellar secretion chaperone FliS